MIIGKKDIERMQQLEDNLRTASQRIDELQEYRVGLEEQNQRLAKTISLKAKDRTGCKVGPWCDDCIHRQTDFTNLLYSSSNGNCYYNAVSYCAKHIHELCPEWEPHKSKKG